VEWVAIGVGVNLRDPEAVPPDVRPAVLRSGVRRADVLAAIIPLLRSATQHSGELTPEELSAWQARDAMRGRPCMEPAVGVVQGIDATGALVVQSGAALRSYRTGSLVLLPTH
jgi:biotin-(acetyl-CoA carboxylase) ligase